MKKDFREILCSLRDERILTEDELLQKLPNGNTVFEYAIKNGKNIYCEKFIETKSLDIILKNERYDFLSKVDLKTLLKINKKILNERYIETILKLFKEGYEINISINPFKDGNSLNDVANLYIIYAKYDLVEFLPLLDKKLLLDKNEEHKKNNLVSKIGTYIFGKKNLTLIDLLLKKDSKLTTSKIVHKKIQNDFDIAMILRTHDIFKRNVEYDLKPNNFISNLLNGINSKYDNILLSYEEEYLLRTLFSTFSRCSDDAALKALINSYKIQFRKGNRDIIKEIKLLIKLKESGSDLSFKIGQNQYLTESNTVEIENEFISNINHELGHALIHNLTDEAVPDGFYEIIDRILDKSSTLRKVHEFSERAEINSNKLKEWVNKVYITEFPLMNKVIEFYKVRNTYLKKPNDRLLEKASELSKDTADLRREIIIYLKEAKEEKKKIYRENGYSEEDIETLFYNTFSVKNYARMHKKIQKKEFYSVLSSTLLAPLDSIGDILDAIYRGYFFAGKLYYKDNKIEPVSGHGLFYYNYNKCTIFDEIFADYRTILMSEYSEEYLKELRYYVGDELVDFLNNYYNKILLNSMEFEDKRGSSEEGKLIL